jgi:branched-chain amino acid aminotransferase
MKIEICCILICSPLNDRDSIAPFQPFVKQAIWVIVNGFWGGTFTMSPAYIRVLTPSGLETVSYSADSLQDAVQYEPAGVYTVTNTFNRTRTLRLHAHLDRLEQSAGQEGIELVLDRSRLREALRQMIEAADFGDVRFRLSIPQDQPDHMIITLEPFTPLPSATVYSGVRCVLAPGLARRKPASKTNDWMTERSRFNKPPGVHEALLVNDEGQILEGLGSNFYAVLNGELRTAGEHVLAGIAQQIVFIVAPPLIILRRDAVHVDDLPLLDEAFITSSSRGIISVVQIDDQIIGDGTPGPRTMALRRVYNRWVDANLEEL